MALGRSAQAELLSQVPLFSRCSKRDLAAVARLTQQIELPAGHTLIQEGVAVAYSFFILIEGRAEVSQQGRVVSTLKRGDFFGELALILRGPRTATVTLTERSQLLWISAHNFQPLLMRSPEIQFKLLEVLADRAGNAARLST